MWDCSCSCRGVGLLSTPPPPACCGLGLGLGFLSLGAPAFSAPSAARLGLGSRPPLSLSCWAARSASLNSADVDTRTPAPPVHPFRVSSGVHDPESPILSPISLSIPFGDREVIIETGLIGRQANGAVTVSDGETIVYTTVCASTDPTEPSDFVPLTVQYQERLSAAGRTSGGFIKREGRARENEILVCRLIDRPIRPLIAKGFNYETQVLVWVLSYDGVHAPEPLAITSAGAALALSDIPFERAVAGVRVGYIDGAYVVNPTVQQLSLSKLDLVLAGTSEAVLMIEGYCEFLTEEQLLTAVEVGQQAISKICGELENFASKFGKKKNLDAISLPPTVIEGYIQDLFGEKLASALQIKGKKARAAAIGVLEQKILTALTEDGLDQVANKDDERDAMWDEEEEEESVVEDGEVDEGDVHVKPVLRRPITQRFDPVDVKTVFKDVSSKVMRELIVQKGLRSDGRGVTQVRPIQSLCGLLPRAHGSALFTRGETQALAVVTLGGNDMGQRLDNLNNIEDIKRFYLQYTFPPSCVGETGRIGAPTRREIGHGTLAERALEPVLPLETEFPYTIRVESTITESNGSSSMASVCGGCLAMLDAGIPLKGPIAGVAMGLILKTRECGGDGEPVILTDILGSEDALGDMDFKIAGNEVGITAFQMDIKVEGISLKILEKALAQAKIGRQHILAEMTKSSPPPARSLSKYAPLIEMMKVDSDKLNIVIGPGGKTVKGIIEETGVDTIDIEDDGSISICGKSMESLLLAKARIAGLTMVPVIGQIYRNCVVKRVIAFGCFVELAPGREALLHISELSTKRVARVEDVVNEGDRLDVKLIEINARGQLRVSRRALLPAEPPEQPAGEGEKKPKISDPRVWRKQTDQPAGVADGKTKQSETISGTDTADQTPSVADEEGEKKTKIKSDQPPLVADGEGEKKTWIKSDQPPVVADGEGEKKTRIKSDQPPLVADGEGEKKTRIKSDQPPLVADVEGEKKTRIKSAQSTAVTDGEGEKKTRMKSDQPPAVADGEGEKKTRIKSDQPRAAAEGEGAAKRTKQSAGTRKSDQPRAEGVKRTRRTDASLGTETGRKISKQRELNSGARDNGDAATVKLAGMDKQLGLLAEAEL